MEELTIVVGGQAGSEGKGAVCARLHKERPYQVAVRVGGPNAGHTVIGAEGKRFALRQLPAAAVADQRAQLVIAAGSEVDPEVLNYEIGLCEENGYKVRDRLLVDREATVVEDRHAQAEGEIRTGTTGKGIGAARADRALRRAKRVADCDLSGLFKVTDTQEMLRRLTERRTPVLIEGTQGYVLGSHAGSYPYCTSGDCRAADFLAACGLPPQDAEVWVVLRTYPIRIAGRSGELKHEITWDDVGVDPEFTTVTQKQRRVGEWDWDWAEASVDANRGPGGVQIALTFADYWWPAMAGVDGFRKLRRLPVGATAKIQEIETKLRAKVLILGTGPDTQILVEGA